MSARLHHLPLTFAALFVLGAAPGAAQPTGGNVVGGTATIQGAGTNSVVVNQGSDRAIINWTTFNINTGGSATFHQPSSSSIVLNRVTGGMGPSTIDGTITANGRVFIVNRDGMLFGRNAVVNTAGFLATTHDIRNADFMAGRMNFNISGRPDASIVNLGRITASSHGFAALVAPGVRNSGTISARLGTVALASGNSFTLDMYGDRLIQLAVGDEIARKVIDVQTGRPLTSLVTNEGKIRANGGRVELTAATARAVVDSVINNRGVIEANSVGRRNGKIVLGGSTGGAGLPKQTIKISGKISAKGTTRLATAPKQANPRHAGKRKGGTGGTILITGEDIQFAAAMLDVSAPRGGGKILVGGDYGGGKPIPGGVNNQSAVLEGYAIPTASTVSVDGATTFNASATRSGHGGKVILWSDTLTTFAGTIYARGGEQAGDGGFVEVSGKQQLAFTGLVDTRAPMGTTGTLLLDPDDFTIDANNVGSIVTTLGQSNVIIATDAMGTGGNGDIHVNAQIDWSADTTLTLSAFRDINVSALVSVPTIRNTGAGNLILRADNTGIGTGTINLAAMTSANRVDWSGSTGRVSFYYNPTPLITGGNKYLNPKDFSSPTANGRVVTATPDQFTAYMLVNSATDLANIDLASNRSYALGRDFSAATFPGFVGTPTFVGLFDGHGGLGVNHTISDLALTSTTLNAPIGLFPIIGQGGIVRNLTVVTSPTTVTAGANNQSIGVIAGLNQGLIEKVVTQGVVDGGAFQGINAGGIAGINDESGIIRDSISRANVSVGNVNNFAGGGAGANFGHIIRVATGGDVNAGSSSFAGGVAGINARVGVFGGEIIDSYSLSTVSGGIAAGLVANNTLGEIRTSFSAGRVNATAIGGGLVATDNGNGIVTNSFWDKETSGQTTSAGSPVSSGLTTMQLQAALQGGWNANVWGIIPGVSYPYLQSHFTGTPQVVSGFAFNNDGSAAAGTHVSGLIDGNALHSVLTGGAATTGANGYYYYLLAPNTIVANSQVLTNTAGSNAGVAFAHNANGSVTGLNILGGYRHDVTGPTTLSALDNALALAIGGSTSTQALVDAMPNRRIDVGGGAFSIDKPLDVANTLVLATQGTITQTAPITAANLALLGTGGVHNLLNANNQIGTLAADTGTIFLNDNGELTIGTVAGFSGVRATNLFGISSGGNVTQTAPIITPSLAAVGGGNFMLTNANNDVGTFAAAGGGNISLTDNGALNIGTVMNVTGVQANSLTLRSSGTVTQTAPIMADSLALFGDNATFALNNAGNQVGTLGALVLGDTGAVHFTGNGGFAIGPVDGALGLTAYTVTLSSNGPVTQTGPLSVGDLALLGHNATYALNHAANQIGTLAAHVTGNGTISITDTNTLSIGTVAGIAGVTAETVILSSMGAVTQTEAITATSLALLGTGANYTLNHAGNQIATLAAHTGSVSLTDQGDINIGTVAGVSGVTAGALTMQQIGSTITATAPVNVGSFNLVAGNWVQVAAALPSFHASNFSIGANASFLRATGGTGSVANPYAITDVYGLQGISGVLLGRSFSLANNIDASAAAGWNGGAGFAPIGGAGTPFAGSFDGLGRTISNLAIAPTDAFNVGMFGVIGAGGSVSNLNLTNASVTANSVLQAAGILAGTNDGRISRVNVAGTINSAGFLAGGLVAVNTGTIGNSSAATNVNIATGIAGGFAGFNLGAITLSFATGNVTGGLGAILGGFVGVNAGLINQAYATGAVTGGDASIAGGFAGLNVAFNFDPTAATTGAAAAVITGSPVMGSISQAYALGPVTVGNMGFAAGFAAFNFGDLDQVYAAGRVQGGAGAVLGGLVALSGAPDTGEFTGIALSGTVTNSFWDMQTTGITTSAGGTGMNTAELAGGLPPGFDPAIWSHGSYPFLVNLGPQNTTPGPPVIPPVILPVDPPINPPTAPTEPPIPPTVGPINPPVGPTVDSTITALFPLPLVPPALQQINANAGQLAHPLNANQSVNTPQLVQQFLQAQSKQGQQKGPGQQQGGPGGGPGQPGGPGGPGPGGGAGGGPTGLGPQPIRLDVGENRHFYLPPPGETRLVRNEVVLQLPCDVVQADLNAILTQHNLTVLGSQCLQAGGTAAYRMGHASSQSIANVIQALAAHRIIAAAQANYVYTLQEDTKVQAVTSEQGDPGQYVPEKLRLAMIHRLVRGNNIPIAVIDSEIDGAHPDLSGAITDRYDATGVEDSPHAHGTGMAGAIVSRQKLLGVAPGARIVAIRAFSSRAASAESTTFNILKGLDWAVNNNVRIVNMSFAGPRDPSLERALKSAHDKGLVLVAAAGNAGPRAFPLYPAADPNVIAVTATDIEDKLFTGANRGSHLAISAPGVDILVPAPAGEYQVTTGTSVATAHISGVIALLLERNPKLTPADVRKILIGSARRLGPSNQFGAGLVDPVRALELATPRSAAAPPARR